MKDNEIIKFENGSSIKLLKSDNSTRGIRSKNIYFTKSTEDVDEEILYKAILSYVRENSGCYDINYPDVANFIIDNYTGLGLLFNELFDNDVIDNPTFATEHSAEWTGGDSLGSNGYTKAVQSQPKIFRNNV